MSSADDLQQDHRVPAALAARLAAISAGTADAHELHQAGVLLSKMADAAWRIAYPGWLQDMQELLRLADVFFGRALTMLPKDNQLAKDAVVCDRALAYARTLRVPELQDMSLIVITQMLDDVMLRLNAAVGLDRIALDGKHHYTHQLAIAQSFMMRVYASAWMTSGLLPYAVGAAEHDTLAAYYFNVGSESSPDDNRAFASHLIALALLKSERKRYLLRWQNCMQAYHWARMAKDRRQQVHALVVGYFGNTGERWLLKRAFPLSSFGAVIKMAQKAAQNIAHP